MILTPQQKDQLLQSRGLSLSDYDIDEDLNVVQRDTPVIEQPSISPSALGPPKFGNTTTPNSSTIGAFGKSFAEEAPSSIVGGLGGGAGLALGTALAPETGGLSFLIPLLSTLAGGFGASALARKVQQKVEPQDWQQNVQQSAQEHPIASTLGRLSAIPLSGFNPNPLNVARAGGGLAKLVTGAPMEANELSNLINVGAGAGIGAGANTVEQLQSPEPFSPLKLAGAAGVGALFNTPSKLIGQRLGFHNTAIPDIHTTLKGGLDQVPNAPIDIESTATTVEPPIDESPEAIAQITKDDQNALRAYQQRVKEFKLAQQELATKQVDLSQSQIDNQIADIEQQIKQNQIRSTEKVPNVTETPPVEAPKQTSADLADLQSRKAKGFTQDKYSEESELPSDKKFSYNEWRQEFKAALDNKDYPYLTKIISDYPDYIDIMRQGNSGGGVVGADITSKNAEVTPIRTKLQEEILSKKDTIPLNANEKWYSGLTKFLESKGLKVDENNKLVSDTGKPIAGKTSVDGKGIATLIETNPSKRGADTHIHEGIHAFLGALRNSNRAGDRRMVSDFERVVSEHPDYQEWKTARDAAGVASTPEEYIATNAGYQFLKRHLNVEGESPLKQWVNDFKSYLKTRFTKYGTAEDYQRLLDNRFTQERKPLSEYYGGIHTPSINVPGTTENLSEGGKDTLQKSADRYKELTGKVRDIVGKGKMPPQDILQEIESLKNANKGMPPSAEKLSEHSELAQPTHDTVKNLIDVVSSKELKEADAQEVRKILLSKVDWDEMPDLGQYLKNKMFDATNPKDWQHVSEIYNKYLSEPTVQKAIAQIEKPISKQAPPQPVQQPKPTIQQPKPVVSKQNKYVTPGFEAPPKREYTPPKLDEFKPEDLAKEREAAKREWEEVDNTKNPKKLAQTLKERYQKIQENIQQLKSEGYKRESSEMQFLDRRLRGTKLKYDTLADKHDLELPDITGTEHYSEESELRLRNRRNVQHNLEDADRQGIMNDYLHHLKNIPLLRDTDSGPYPVEVSPDHNGKFYTTQGDMHLIRVSDGVSEPQYEPAYFLYHQEQGDLDKGIRYSTESLLPSVVQPEIQKIRNLENPQSDDLANSLTKFYELKRKYTGSLTNDFLGNVLPTIPKTNLKGQFLQNTPDIQSVLDRRNELKDTGSSNIVLSPKAQEIENHLADTLSKAQALRDSFPGLSKRMNFGADYLPPTPSRSALDTILNHSGTPEYQQLMTDWHDYYRNILGKSLPEDKAALGTFMAAYKKGTANLAEHYGPIDDAFGIDIPPSWREKNLVDLISRFLGRFGRRIAYHEAVETDPNAMRLLTDDENGLAAAEPVKNVMHDIAGIRENEEAKRIAFGGLVRSAMLGPLTGAKDLLSNFTLGMQHQTLPQSIVTPLKALSDISNNIKESFKAGVNRYNISAIEIGDDGSISNLSNITRRIRDVVSTTQGRNFLEKVTRGIAYGQGKLIAMDNLWAAHNNTASKQQLKFLDDFAPNWQQHQNTGQFTPEALMEAASKYVESVQGTYDYRGLPSIAQKGTLAPYLSLARWNIEKMNNFEKYVVNPARQGNITPLLMSTLGMVIGGEAVNQLVQLVTTRKEKTPNYKELQAIAQEPEGKLSQAIVYKLAGLASLSGYAGILGDLSKAGMDVWFKNQPQPYNNPLIAGVGDLAQNVQFAVEAFRNGNFNIGAEGLSQVLQDFFQSYRIALAHLDPEKMQENEKANKLRDLKLFKTTTGLPVGDVTTDKANPFIDKDTKDFKRTEDLNEAAQLLPQLLERAFKRADGNIDVLERELTKIKENSYQTMPSPERMPASFIRYMNRLSQSQGPQVAGERLSDYLLQNAKNQVKGEMVPSL